MRETTELWLAGTGLGDQRRWGIARKAMMSQTGLHSSRSVHGIDRLVCAIADDGALVGHLKKAQISRHTGFVGFAQIFLALFSLKFLDSRIWGH